MTSWSQGFCIGSIITAVLILALLTYAAVYHSGTISQTEEKREP